MCGRYYRRSDKQRIAEAYRLGEIPFDLVLPDWDFNVAPTTFQPVIRDGRDTGERELVLMRWGLVPFLILLAKSANLLVKIENSDSDPWPELKEAV
jgi:putative SOS response-associated peptidase YedK